MMRRAMFVLGLALGTLALAPGVALAHGVGGRQDLPIPLEWSLLVAGVVVVGSFVLLGSLWTEARLQDGPRARPLRAAWVGPVGRVLAVLGVVFFVVALLGGMIGSGSPTRAMSPFIVFVLFWLVVPFAGALLGDLYTIVNPWRTVGKGAAVPERPVPEGLGVWPAALAFLAFTWLELVATRGSEPRSLSIAIIVYTAWIVFWVARYGLDNGLRAGDTFTTYNRVISAIAPFGRSPDGTLVWRGWLRALPVLPQWRGLTPFVLLMIGTVTYDGLSSSIRWDNWFGTTARTTWFASLSLVGITAIIGAAYYGASWFAARLGEVDRPAREVADSFAHTLVPIGLAYAFAHYFTLVLFEGQKLLSTVSDPFDLGWNLFGTVDWNIVYWFPSDAVWWVQLGSIAFGHVLGVVLAHDRALVDFPKRNAMRSQWAMLALMVLLTSLGLFILAEG
ncbi:MAG: hypothetical protein OEO77_01325 [Acidimicrobiia bacterium]|nr:hypothetical protein [Acidimicrobiia bacterium]